jgi:hypothetical protein
MIWLLLVLGTLVVFATGAAYGYAIGRTEGVEATYDAIETYYRTRR